MFRLLILFFALMPLPAAAQPPNIEVIEYLGIKHFIHYDIASPGDLLNYRSALETALPVIDALWGDTSTDPVIVIDLAPLPDVTEEGDPWIETRTENLSASSLPFSIEDLPERVCYIELYAAPFALDLLFEVAKQVAHCYQWFNVAALTESTVPLALHNWWYEGGATWMASLVDDSIGVGIWEKAQQELIDRREQTLVKGRYDAYYWWAYAADALGPDEMITLQVFMPADVNEHAAYVADKLGDADAFMHEYALKLSNQDLAHGPFPDDLYTHYPITDLPSFALLSSETLGVGWTQLDINVDLDADEGFELEVITIDSSGLRISLDDGTLLLKNEPVKFCDPLPKPRLIFSRAVSGTESDPPAEAQILITRVDCDEPTEEAEDVNSCIIGSWLLTDQPSFPGMEMTFGGTQIVTVAEDWTTVTRYEDFTLQTEVEDVGPMQMTFNGEMHSKLAVDDDGYVVDGGEVRGDVQAAVSVAGTTINMSMNDVIAAGVEMGILPGTQINCTRTMLRLTVPVTGISGDYVFNRMEEEE